MKLEKLLKEPSEEQLKNRETFFGKMCIHSKLKYVTLSLMILSGGIAGTGLVYGTKKLFDYLLR